MIFIIMWLVVGIPATLWRAYVLKTLWWWYLTPAGVPGISMKTAIGLMLVIGLITFRASKRDLDEEEGKYTRKDYIRSVVLSAFLPLAILFFAQCPL
jgi:hypothetical protein